jgi:hypothetical protein
MKRINLFELFQFGAALKTIGRLKPDTIISSIESELFLAEIWLKWLLSHDHIPITDNRDEAERLVGFIGHIKTIPAGEQLGISKHIIISTMFSELEAKLSTELARLHVYLITPVLGYDSDILLSNGRATLSAATLEWLPEDAAIGFDDGTRCLALKQATAAGFLLLRSVEGMMHDFYDVISNDAPRPERRNMGDYIAALETVDGTSPEMLGVLRSIKNLRRNPLMHHDHRLEMDDAVETFDVAKSAISAMARLAKEHAANKKP